MGKKKTPKAEAEPVPAAPAEPIAEAPQFIRGRSMWHTPSYNHYGKKSDPYWDIRFVYYMRELPPSIREDYLELKTKRAKERVQRYLDQVERERERNEGQDPRKYVEQIKKWPEEKWATLLSSRGTYSKDRIQYEFGLPDNLARAVAAGLSIQGSEES